MSNERTITVKGHLRDKKVTKEDFVNQWKCHAVELKNLDWSNEWLDEVNLMIDRVKEKAAEKFETAYKHEQTKKES